MPHKKKLSREEKITYILEYSRIDPKNFATARRFFADLSDSAIDARYEQHERKMASLSKWARKKESVTPASS